MSLGARYSGLNDGLFGLMVVISIVIFSSIGLVACEEGDSSNTTTKPSQPGGDLPHAAAQDCSCKHGGTCDHNLPGGLPVCICPPGFYGSRCEGMDSGPQPWMFAIGIPVGMILIVLLFTGIGGTIYYFKVGRKRKHYIIHRNLRPMESLDTGMTSAETGGQELHRIDDRVNILSGEIA